MVFKRGRGGSVITKGGMKSDAAGLWGITWFSRRGRGGNQSSRGGGSRTSEESLGFQGGRGDQSQLTEIKGKT